MSIPTSRAARDSMRDQARTDRLAVLWAFRTFGALTADEAAARLHWSDPYRARRRVSELKADGALVETGETRRTKSGRQAAVLRIPDAERQMRFA